MQTDQTHLHQFKLPILLIRTASYSWHGNLAAPRTTSRQVSWLIDLHALPSSRSPSEFWHAFPKYSDEFVQDSHLFPFSPDQNNLLISSDTYCFSIQLAEIYHISTKIAIIFSSRNLLFRSRKISYQNFPTLKPLIKSFNFSACPFISWLAAAHSWEVAELDCTTSLI